MSKQIVFSEKAPAAIGPYSQAVVANGLLFISGQIALHPETQQLINGSIQEETQQVMKNLQAILWEAGIGFEQVVKTTIFLMDMQDFSVVNEIYATFFSAQFPARETVQVAGLPRGVRVEISMTALIRS